MSENDGIVQYMAIINEADSIDYYNKQPGKRIGGGVLIFDEIGRLLIVKPTYRNTWAWPGGGSEPGESPLETAVRECKEEIGYEPRSLQPAFVDYIPPREDGSLDVIHFVFKTERVESNLIETLQLPEDEIEDARFIPVNNLGDYLKPYRTRAVESYLAHHVTGAFTYLEDGRLL